MPNASHAPRMSISSLRTQFAGQVIGPDDPDYESARTIQSGEYDLHPAVIVRVAHDDDVAKVIQLARETGLDLAIRSGAHSGAGHGSAEGGIVLDLSAMKTFELASDGETVWADAGMTAGDFTRTAAAHGKAVGFGDTASVGIGGITLGGGIGYLVRKYGLTIDSLLAADMVLADGSRVRVDESTPDLFWAIRGGGGNFGVVTRFRFRLAPVDRIVGGMLMLPATPDALAGFIAASEEAPDELSGIGNVMPAPPMPFIPEEHRGRLVIMALMAYVGAVADGERAFAPFRALGKPVVDMVRPISYPELYPPEDTSYHPRAVARNMFTSRVDRDLAAQVIERLEASDAPMRVAQLRVLGGAMARVPADATAFAHRSSRIMANVAAFYTGPGDYDARAAWVGDVVGLLQQEDTGVYVNFLQEEGPDRVRAAYPGATWDRLLEIKARYDPENLFRRNQNVARVAVEA